MQIDDSDLDRLAPPGDSPSFNSSPLSNLRLNSPIDREFDEVCADRGRESSRARATKFAEIRQTHSIDIRAPASYHLSQVTPCLLTRART